MDTKGVNVPRLAAVTIQVAMLGIVPPKA